MKKFLAVLVVLHCGCTLFKSSPNFEQADTTVLDAGSDADPKSDDGSNRDVAAVDVPVDGLEDVGLCPQDSAGCSPGDEIACSELGFDRGAASCDACEWVTTECETCDFFFSDQGDDGNDGTSPATAYQTLRPLSTHLAQGGDGSTFCLERGSVFEVFAAVNIVRDNLLITAYGDPNTPLPVLRGFEVTVEDSVDPEFSHQAAIPDGVIADVIWTSEEWSQIDYYETTHRARQDENVLFFNAAETGEAGYVSPSAVFTTNADSARSNVVVENLRFENVGTGILFGAESQDTNSFDFRSLEFDFVIFGVQTRSSSFGSFVQLRGIRIRDSSFTNYIVGILVRSMPEDSQDDNFVVEGNTLGRPLAYRPTEIVPGVSPYKNTAIQIGTWGRATIKNNRIDLGDSAFSTGISLLIPLIPNVGTGIPFRSGTVIGNHVIGGETGIRCDGGQETSTLIANNIVVGSEIGIIAGGGRAPFTVVHNVVADTSEIGVEIEINPQQVLGSRFVGNIVDTNAGSVLRFVGPAEHLESDFNLYNRVSILRSGELTTFDPWRAEGFGLDSNASADPLPEEINSLADYATTRDASVRYVDSITERVEVDFFGTDRSETPTIGAIEVPED